MRVRHVYTIKWRIIFIHVSNSEPIQSILLHDKNSCSRLERILGVRILCVIHLVVPLVVLIPLIDRDRAKHLMQSKLGFMLLNNTCGYSRFWFDGYNPNDQTIREWERDIVFSALHVFPQGLFPLVAIRNPYEMVLFREAYYPIFE